MAILSPASLGGNEAAISYISAWTCQAYGLTGADVQTAKACLLLCGAREQHRRHTDRRGRRPSVSSGLAVSRNNCSKAARKGGPARREAGHANSATSE
jgi:hypothetical protein